MSDIFEISYTWSNLFSFLFFEYHVSDNSGVPFDSHSMWCDIFASQINVVSSILCPFASNGKATFVVIIIVTCCFTALFETGLWLSYPLSGTINDIRTFVVNLINLIVWIVSSQVQNSENCSRSASWRRLMTCSWL